MMIVSPGLKPIEIIAAQRWSMPLVSLLIFAAVLVLVLPFALSGYGIDPALAYYPPEALPRLYYVVIAAISSNVIALVWLCRRASSDMALLALTPAEALSLNQAVLLPAWVKPACCLFFVSLVHISISFGDLANQVGHGVDTHLGRLLAIWHSGPVTLIYVAAGHTLIGLLTGLLVYFLVWQRALLNCLVDLIELDIYDLERLNVISNPCIRLIVLLLVSTSGMTFTGLVSGLGGHDVLSIVIILWLIDVPLILLLGVPVLRVRNKVVALKAAALAELTPKLRSADSLPAGKLADLLGLRLYIESRWEWPVAAHVQKLVLFGILPPLTWVLAAVIENLLY